MISFLSSFFPKKFTPQNHFAGRPTLSQRGLGADAPHNWREVFLDSEDAHIWGRELGWASGAMTPRASSITPGATATPATGASIGPSSPACWTMTTGRR